MKQCCAGAYIPVGVGFDCGFELIGFRLMVKSGDVVIIQIAVVSCCFVCIVADESNVNHWPEILKFLFACCDVNLPHLYESALNIIRCVFTCVCVCVCVCVRARARACMYACQG